MFTWLYVDFCCGRVAEGIDFICEFEEFTYPMLEMA